MKDEGCKNCQNRHPKCHADCEEHLKRQARLAEEKEARRKENLRRQGIEKPYLRSINIKKKER